mmetsp:Transcript_135080/g.431194  ORF Transcript_135080/g.431194 Transcript_135080/m.431194 type:complete len:455 (-) Transcript_135080:210-1574(-)
MLLAVFLTAFLRVHARACWQTLLRLPRHLAECFRVRPWRVRLAWLLCTDGSRVVRIRSKEMHLQRLRNVMRIAFYVMLANMAGAVYEHARKWEGRVVALFTRDTSFAVDNQGGLRNVSSYFIREKLYHSSLIPVMIFACWVIGFHVFGFSSRRFRNFGNCALSTAWALMFLGTSRAMVSSMEEYLYMEGWIMSARLVQSLLLGNVGLTTILNLALIAIDVWSVTFFFPTGSLDPSVFKNGDYVLRQLSQCMLLVVIAWTFERSTLREAKTHTEATDMRRSQQLVGQLMSGTCDVVVHLDESLHVTAGNRKLAALLLRQLHLDSPVSRSFINFVHEEDRQTFKDCLRRSARNPADEPAIAGYIRLVDSLQNVVRTSMRCSTLSIEDCGVPAEIIILGLSVVSDSVHDCEMPAPLSSSIGIGTERFAAARSTGAAATMSPTLAPTLVGMAAACSAE